MLRHVREKRKTSKRKEENLNFGTTSDTRVWLPVSSKVKSKDGRCKPRKQFLKDIRKRMKRETLRPNKTNGKGRRRMVKWTRRILQDKINAGNTLDWTFLNSSQWKQHQIFTKINCFKYFFNTECTAVYKIINNCINFEKTIFWYTLMLQKLIFMKLNIIGKFLYIYQVFLHIVPERIKESHLSSKFI